MTQDILQSSRQNSTRSSGLIRLDGVSKQFVTPSGSFTALREVSMDIRNGEFVAVVGKSGSGKTTLLNVITGIDNPSSGEIYVADASVHAMAQEELASWRGKHIGIIFQFFQLLPTLTVAENVMLPMDFCNTYPLRVRRDRAISLLDRLGIGEQADKLPADLSGGQQQRAAIARALANDPPILVADEPTGNLDSKTSGEVMQFFDALAKEGKTILMVTHEHDLSTYFSRSITLIDGAIPPEEASGIKRDHHA